MGTVGEIVAAMKMRWSILLLAVVGTGLVLLAIQSREPRFESKGLSK